jgi:hypothetical protein
MARRHGCWLSSLLKHLSRLHLYGPAGRSPSSISMAVGSALYDVDLFVYSRRVQKARTSIMKAQDISAAFGIRWTCKEVGPGVRTKGDGSNPRCTVESVLRSGVKRCASA